MDVAAASALRSVVHDCLAKHMYEAAAFFADKLVTASGYAPAEVYTLAQAGPLLSLPGSCRALCVACCGCAAAVQWLPKCKQHRDC